MINILLTLARYAAEFALPAEATAARAGLSLLRRGSIIERTAARRAFRGGRRMGVLDAALSGIKRGAAGGEVIPAEPPTRILPPLPGMPGEMPVAPTINPERIPVPPGAFPYNPLPGNYFQSNRFTQNVYNSNANNAPGPQPPQQKEVSLDPKLNNLIKADITSNILSLARSGADSWLPHISWEGVVSATGFKTTPTRTVVHYALAVAFGLIKQQRVSSCSLVVDIDYETNHVSVAYVSKAYWLTELMTLNIYALTGTLPPELVKDIGAISAKSVDILSRSLTAGFKQGPTQAIIELGGGAIKLAGDALKVILKGYQSLGRMLGPLGVYDMGDDTLYGGRASALLRAPFQPEPFASMQTDKDGKPVPLLTRLPAPNPQPAVAVGTDPSSGYSLDLRSLVAQAIYDPGIIPPTPDTNVSLAPVF